MLLSSSHNQTYFSKIICCLWDVSPQLLHGPIWIALSGCQSGIIFVNVVSVFFNLDTHTQKNSKVSWWSENNKYTYFTRRKKVIKPLWQSPNSIHVHAICVEFTVTASHPSQPWIQFCQTASVTVCFQQPCGLQFHIICFFSLLMLSLFPFQHTTELVPGSA